CGTRLGRWDGLFREDAAAEAQVEVLGVRRALRELAAQAQERHEPRAVGRVAEQQDLAGAAQHHAQVARRLDEDLRDLGSELAQVGEQRTRPPRALAARLFLDR